MESRALHKLGNAPALNCTSRPPLTKITKHQCSIRAVSALQARKVDEQEKACDEDLGREAPGRWLSPGEAVTAMAAPLQEHVEVSDIFMLCVSSNEFCFEY